MPELWEHLGSGGVCHTSVRLCMHMSGIVLVRHTHQACLPGAHTLVARTEKYDYNKKTLLGMPELWEHLGSGGVCHTSVCLYMHMSGIVLVRDTHTPGLPARCPYSNIIFRNV